MVIQEAFACGRPLVVSDIGGMKEKVRNGCDGVHASAGNALQWKAALMSAATSTRNYDALVAGIARPECHRITARRHCHLMTQAGQS